MLLIRSNMLFKFSISSLRVYLPPYVLFNAIITFVRCLRPNFPCFNAVRILYNLSFNLESLI